MSHTSPQDDRVLRGDWTYLGFNYRNLDRNYGLNVTYKFSLTDRQLISIAQNHKMVLIPEEAAWHQ